MTLTVSRQGATWTDVVELAAWPPDTHAAPTKPVSLDRAVAANPHPDTPGEPLPDHAVALNVDLGVVADVRRVLTSLYCWPDWSS